ncbi:hypothetical protein F4810DRAFT_17677 [Camillea tinctor]|nr:hypothetical protein F4810DRAFT_17677 [Camillea tinctor]
MTTMPTANTNPPVEDQSHSSPLQPHLASSHLALEANAHVNMNAPGPHEDIPELSSYYSFGMLEEETSDSAAMESSPATNSEGQHHLPHSDQDREGDLYYVPVNVVEDEDVDIKMEDPDDDVDDDDGGAKIEAEPIHHDGDNDENEEDNEDGENDKYSQNSFSWVHEILPIASIPINARRTSNPAVLLHGSSPLRQVTHSWEVPAPRERRRIHPSKRLRLDRPDRAASFTDGQNEAGAEATTSTVAIATAEWQSSPLPIRSQPSPELGHDDMMDDARPSDIDMAMDRAIYGDDLTPSAVVASWGYSIDDVEVLDEGEDEEEGEQNAETPDNENKENEANGNDEQATPIAIRTRAQQDAARVPLQAWVEEIEVYSGPSTEQG